MFLWLLFLMKNSCKNEKTIYVLNCLKFSLIGSQLFREGTVSLVSIDQTYIQFPEKIGTYFNVLVE